jgi:zinc D-Ala-D-Ala dipeptidase
VRGDLSKMRIVIYSLITFGALAISCHRSPTESRQLLVIQTGNWTSPVGEAYRFIGSVGQWRPVGRSFPVSVGRSGLGWGIGEPSLQRTGEPIKREGDGRAPAGRFPLLEAFGRNLQPSQYPYLSLTTSSVCVDDPSAAQYNTFQEAGPQPRPWLSAEPLYDIDVYDLGVIVGYNTERPKPGRGSCVFLHRWETPHAATAGCTAMSASNLTALLEWLDQTKKPIIVQLPRAQYERLRAPWRLPILP